MVNTFSYNEVYPLFRNTNEPLEVIVRKLPVAGQRIFSVLGSGVFPLEFLRRGADKVVAVDSNDAQLFWSRLYFVSIENLSYHEFGRAFLDKQGKQVLAANECYRKAISEAFDNELAAKALEMIAISSYIGRADLIRRTTDFEPLYGSMFVNMWSFFFSRYYRWVCSKVEYDKVQNGIRKGKLIVLKGEIPECLHQFDDRSFDVAYLSNVVEWLEQKEPQQLRAVDTVGKQLVKILSPTGIAYLKTFYSTLHPLDDWETLFDVTKGKENGYLLTKRV